MTYVPPLRDIRFVLHELLDTTAALASMPPFDGIDVELIDRIVAEAGRFTAEVLAPLSAVGDRSGCGYRDGAVRTPPGFADAYRRFCELGWPSLACDPAYGGQGLPRILNAVLYEMLGSANHAWTMYPGLAHGAYACLRAHAPDWIKALYLPPLVSGEWLATMCLTEPQAGTDLGLLRTRAERQADGSYRVSGSKIFISGGEQDFTGNIVHLVLARMPGAPEGSRGLSLFLAPKLLPRDDGLPERNAIHCDGIEHKMGIAGSATCAMRFDEATAWLIGEPNRGLSAMFVMMNAARLQVGLQGLGHIEAALQKSRIYAEERLQAKAPARPPRAVAVADPIAMHPAVQRMLMTQRAHAEGGRAFAYWTGLMLDTAESHRDAKTRAWAGDLVALVTPIVKALLTENGFLCASLALQVFGGHGYIRETGIEQHVRDARIAMVYEGTNEIQAIDLLVRKVLGDDGRRLERFLALLEDEAQCARRDDETAAFAEALTVLVGETRAATQAVAERAAIDPEAPYRIAPDYLRLLGHCALAWVWTWSARVAAERRSAGDPLHTAKLLTARYYFTYLLPETAQNLLIIKRCGVPVGASALRQDLS